MYISIIWGWFTAPIRMVILGIVYWVYHINQDISRPSKCPSLSVGHLDMPSISTPGRRDKTLPAAAIPAPGKLRSRTAWKKMGCLGKIWGTFESFWGNFGDWIGSRPISGEATKKWIWRSHTNLFLGSPINPTNRCALLLF